MCVRTRTLAVLLPLTVGDYLLWKWSVAGSHDVIALASGMTLLPLAALSVGRLGVSLLGAVAHTLRGSPRMSRRMRTTPPLTSHRPTNATAAPEALGTGSPGSIPAPAQPATRKLAA